MDGARVDGSRVDGSRVDRARVDGLCILKRGYGKRTYRNAFGCQTSLNLCASFVFFRTLTRNSTEVFT